MRQTYYWPKNDGTPATQGPSMLMASYDDGTNIGFWDSFRDKRGLGFVPDVLEAAYRDWGQDPHGGGWNSWNIGVCDERPWPIIRSQGEGPMCVDR
ncbi:hypothetical protein JQX13_09095 [Archangium violaceum]|uniref:hypothetical protein n=1 Tax=Archangium violaceum TaxID=83451 RepID=UPI00193C4C2E|nr:hypothetical protein [Archangium violaceum]QRK10228.1 hypothetical protein JQX13_09095 [Archangium violaceum]